MSENSLTESVNIQIQSCVFGGVSFPPESILKVKYLNGMKEGEGIVISSMKTKLAKLNFHEDKLDGPCVFFDVDGHKISESVFLKGEVSIVYKLEKGIKKGKYVLNGKRMKEYDADRLVYEGEYKGSVDKGYTRNGIGNCYRTSGSHYSAIFENGVEKRKVREFVDREMVEYDESGRAVYKGEYENTDYVFKRKGKGQLFEYDGEQLIEVYECENGMKTVKRIEFRKNEMTEVNDNGGVVYRGGFEGNPGEGFKRSGEGVEFDEDDMLMYSGQWRGGLRDGQGKFYQNGDLRYEGEWKNGKPNGKGELYNSEGEMIHEGEWKNGELKKGRDIVDYLIGEKKEQYRLSIKNGQEVRKFMTEEWKNRVSEIVILENCGNELKDNVEFRGWMFLEKIIVKKNSLKNLSVLSICDNPVLKSIEIENGDEFYAATHTYEAPFENVKSVVLQSLMID